MGRQPYSNLNLEKFFSGIENIPFKNDGGCLFFCYAFKRYMEIREDISSFRIIQYDWLGSRLQHNLSWPKNTAISSYHFTWLWHGVEYDADGFYYGEGITFRDTLPIPHDKINEFCEEALTESEWNKTFNRMKAIHHIRYTLNLDLDHIR